MRPTLEVLSDLAQMGIRIEIRKAPDPRFTDITLSAGRHHFRRSIDKDVFEKYGSTREKYEEWLREELEDEALKLLAQEAKQ